MTSERDKRYNYYWEKFGEYSKLPMSKPRGKKGRRNGRIFFEASDGLTIVAIPSLGRRDKKSELKCCVEVLIEYSDIVYRNSNIDCNKEAFKRLHDDREAIENELDKLELKWLECGEQEDAKRAKISCCKVFDSNQEEDWHEHYPWFIETIKAFDRVFTHRLEKIKL